jgi:hypothetical protein
MPQFALLTILVIMPLEILSGGTTPRESMRQIVQDIMLAPRISSCWRRRFCSAVLGSM